MEYDQLVATLKFSSLEEVPGRPTHFPDDIPHVNSLHGAPIVVDMRSVDDLKLGLNLPVLDDEFEELYYEWDEQNQDPHLYDKWPRVEQKRMLQGILDKGHQTVEEFFREHKNKDFQEILVQHGEDRIQFHYPSPQWINRPREPHVVA